MGSVRILLSKGVMVGWTHGVVTAALLGGCLNSGEAPLEYGWVSMPWGAEYVGYRDRGDVLKHGDILFERDELLDGPGDFEFVGASYKGDWSLGIVPYEYHPESSEKFRREVDARIAEWNALDTGTFWRPRAGLGSDHVYIIPYLENSSAIGRRGGLQRMRLFDVDQPSVVFHELGHASGLVHEHSRPDSARYIEIN
jgi:hypothetical protein